MVDQLDSTTRSQSPDVDSDDPLAELARIIGYERPVASTQPAPVETQSAEFDLEAELMRELDLMAAGDGEEALESDPEPSAAYDRSAETGSNPEAIEPFVEWQPVEPEEDAYSRDEADGDLGVPSDDISNDAQPDMPADGGGVESGQDLNWDSPELDGAWDISDGPEADLGEQPAVAEDVSLAGAVTSADVPAGSDLADQHDKDHDFGGDDDILADISRFELPVHRREPQTSASADVAAPAEFMADHGLDEAPALEAGDFADHEPVHTVTPDPAAPGDGYSDAPVDFEDYLSAELDVYEQQFTMEAADPASAQDAVNAVAADPEPPVEWREDTWLQDESVFDDAAEDLIAEAGLEAERNDDAAIASELAGGWSTEAIEDAVAEELDEELEDLFDVPGSAEPVGDALVDDLEFDLEQALAETIAAPKDDWSDTWDDRDSAPDTAFDAETDLAAAAANEVAVPASDDRDEIADAFLGLVPAAQDAPGADAGPAEPSEDWLADFEPEQPADLSEENDYYFDAGMISETETSVEPVSEIDVPELESYEPQTIDPDFDNDLEREFADIIDQNEPDDVWRAGIAGAGAATAASVRDWTRPDTGPRGIEAAEDYVALERELVGRFDDREGQQAVHAALSRETAAPGDDEFLMEDTAVRNERGSRGPVLAFVVLGVALVAGAGALGWSMLSDGGDAADGGPRIIRADSEPVKVLPEEPGGVTVPNQDKAVYDRVAGNATTDPGQPSLITTAEEPIDVVQRTLDPELLPLEGRDDPSAKAEDRLPSTPDGAEPGDGEIAAPVVSPRKVRTMVVRPDGSIVPREEPAVEVAASPAIPQPAAPELVTPEPAAPAATAQESDPAAATETETVQTTAEQQPEETAIAPVRVVTTQPIRPVSNAPVPQGRPADQPVTVVGRVNQAGNVAPAPAAPALPAQATEVAAAPVAAAPAANPGGYYVQIASQPTAEGAQASWQALSNRYSNVIGGRGVDIQRADIPGKGVFHRVRIPAGTRDEANALCSRYKSAGGSCFVSR